MVDGTSLLVGIQGFLDAFKVHLKRIWNPPAPSIIVWQCRLYKRFLACGSSGHENKTEALVFWNDEFYLDVSSVLSWIILFVPLNSSPIVRITIVYWAQRGNFLTRFSFQFIFESSDYFARNLAVGRGYFSTLITAWGLYFGCFLFWLFQYFSPPRSWLSA